MNPCVYTCIHMYTYICMIRLYGCRDLFLLLPFFVSKGAMPCIRRCRMCDMTCSCMFHIYVCRDLDVRGDSSRDSFLCASPVCRRARLNTVRVRYDAFIRDMTRVACMTHSYVTCHTHMQTVRVQTVRVRR